MILHDIVRLMVDAQGVLSMARDLATGGDPAIRSNQTDLIGLARTLAFVRDAVLTLTGR